MQSAWETRLLTDLLCLFASCVCMCLSGRINPFWDSACSIHVSYSGSVFVHLDGLDMEKRSKRNINNGAYRALHWEVIAQAYPSWCMLSHILLPDHSVDQVETYRTLHFGLHCTQRFLINFVMKGVRWSHRLRKPNVSQSSMHLHNNFCQFNSKITAHSAMHVHIFLWLGCFCAREQNAWRSGRKYSS